MHAALCIPWIYFEQVFLKISINIRGEYLSYFYRKKYLSRNGNNVFNHYNKSNASKKSELIQPKSIQYSKYFKNLPVILNAPNTFVQK